MHPKTRFQPTRVAADTYLIHNHHGEGQAPVSVPLNAMVIRSREPVVVDTGVAEARDQYLADVFSLVDPGDIRWVYISHDDVDHTGNVNALMRLAPRATLVVNWFMTERMGRSLDVPLSRQHWLNDGQALGVGGRVLRAIRPPVFDSPTTRGLYDPTTGVYWSSDSFATPMLTPVTDVNEIDESFWREGINTFDRYISPWLAQVDDDLFQLAVDRVEAVAPTVMAGSHTPAISGSRVLGAIAATRRSREAVVAPEPDQSVLEQIRNTLDLAA